MLETIADYQAQPLGSVWSHPHYLKHIGAQWNWFQLPFDDDFARTNYRIYRAPTRRVSGSILELGSAMGQGYDMLQASGLVDVSDYTGIDCSDIGHRISRERFPEATWVQTDVSRYTFIRRYDYAFERNAIHHMPDPIGQLRKTLRAVNVAMATTFVGCIEYGTVSDLTLGHYDNEGHGWAYFNVLSLPEVVEAGLAEGFRHIRVIYIAQHEDFENTTHQHLEPSVKATKTLGRYAVRFSRIGGNLGGPMIYLVNGGRWRGVGRWVKEPLNVLRLHSELAAIRVAHAS